MKLRHLLAILIVIVTMTVFLPNALAEEVRITVVADPTELTEAGSVSLSFSISNFSDYELHDIAISSDGVVYDLGETVIRIPMGGSAYDIRIVLNIPDSQIGLEKVFTVSWVQGGEPYSQQVPVTIKRAADPIISLARTASAPMAKQGDTITLDYVLTNSTVFDMTDITLIDEQISDNPISRYTDVLRAGTSITVQYRFTMGAEDVVSAPVITYSVNGKGKTFSAIEPMTLSMMLVKVGASVSLSTPTAAGVTFTIDLKNNGNQELTDVQITDDRGVSLLNPTKTLRVGESIVTEYTVVPDMNEPVRNVAFTVTGKDPYGDDYTLAPERTYEVYPFVDDAQIQTSLRADILDPWTAESGSLKVRITLVNYSEVPISNVQISETTLGLVAQVGALQSGENTFEQIIPLGSPRNLNFTAKGVDPTGTMRELCACTLAVAYTESADPAMETPVPTVQPDDGTLGRTVGKIAGTLSRILIVLGVIMSIAFIGMVVLFIMERSRILQLKKDTAKQQIKQAAKEEKTAKAAPERTDRQIAKTIWTERDHTQPSGAVVPMRHANSPFYRPVEVEYDDEVATDRPNFEDTSEPYFPDEKDFHGVDQVTRAPHSEHTQDYIDVDYERVDAPLRAAGPKSIHLNPGPAVQPKKRPSIKRVREMDKDDNSSKNDR